MTPLVDPSMFAVRPAPQPYWRNALMTGNALGGMGGYGGGWGGPHPLLQASPQMPPWLAVAPHTMGIGPQIGQQFAAPPQMRFGPMPMAQQRY